MDKIEKLIENDIFMESLEGVDSIEEKFKKEGVDIKNELFNADSEELSESELTEATGGAAITLSGLWWLFQIFATTKSLRKHINKLYKIIQEVKQYGYPKSYQDELQQWWNKYLPPSY